MRYQACPGEKDDLLEGKKIVRREESRPSVGEIQDLFFEEYWLLQSSHSREKHLAELKRSFQVAIIGGQL
jgi:hypothetical protein